MQEVPLHKTHEPEITLLNIDCMQFMATLPDKAFDLAVVDPPYGIGESKNTRGGAQYGNAAAVSKDYGIKDWDLKPPEKEYFVELFRVSKQQVIWGANHFISKNPIDSSCWLVWDKQTGNNRYADCELAWTSFKTAVRKFSYRWMGMLQQDMKNKETRIHPTQKPVALYDWILRNYAKPGQRILDTHLGSGSSAIAAHYFGCDFVGCEIDADYFNAAKERFDRETRQVAMW
jgi:site-specific DNA-methyltransferase (adenine-specific)